MKVTTGPIFVAVGAALFGLVPLFMRLYGSEHVFSMAFFRAVVATLGIGIYIRISRGVSPEIHLRKEPLLFSLILALAIVFYLASISLLLIPLAVLLLFTQIIFIVPLSKFLLGEKINNRTRIATLISFVGIVFIVFGGEKIYSNNLDRLLWGMFFGFGAGFFTALNFILVKKWFAKSNPIDLTYNQNFIQSLFLLPLLLIDIPEVSFKSIVSWLGIGLLSTALAFILIYNGAQRTKGQLIGLLQTTEIIVPILLSSIYLNEAPNLQILCGGALLILSYFVLLNVNRL